MTPSPSPRLDPTRLDDHFRQCATACGPWHRLHCIVESLDGLMAPRFVTTLVLTVLVIIGLLWSA